MSNDSYMNEVLVIDMRMDNLGLFIDAPNYHRVRLSMLQKSKWAQNRVLRK